ncbi:hypothetical protein [uncultured Tateyamaria sp.]|uniref:hypothetical protein n=1 Tax=uncultured Tateyamaria sp. TaxID=455651 RepID=UPI00344DDC47
MKKTLSRSGWRFIATIMIIVKSPTSEAWTLRIGGLRSNASRMSHAELDEAEVLDAGDPVELGQLSAELLALLPNIRVIGGCCGTDHRHVGCIAGHDHARSAA